MNNSKKGVALLALPALVLAAWALQLQSRSNAPVLEVQQVTVRSLPGGGRLAVDHQPDTQVNLTVKFNDPRPFWGRRTTSWACEVGYIWWADERGRQHDTAHQCGGRLIALDRDHYLITYECRVQAAEVPSSAAEVSIQARVVAASKYTLPVSVVTHRRIGGSLQIVSPSGARTSKLMSDKSNVAPCKIDKREQIVLSG